MKRLLGLALVVSALSLGCADSMTVDGTTYDTYGIINRDEVRQTNVSYRTVPGSVIWGLILCETVIAPIWFFGFDLYEPVRVNPVAAH